MIELANDVFNAVMDKELFRINEVDSDCDPINNTVEQILLDEPDLNKNNKLFDENEFNKLIDNDNNDNQIDNNYNKFQQLQVDHKILSDETQLNWLLETHKNNELFDKNVLNQLIDDHTNEHTKHNLNQTDNEHDKIEQFELDQKILSDESHLNWLLETHKNHELFNANQLNQLIDDYSNDSKIDNNQMKFQQIIQQNENNASITRLVEDNSQNEPFKIKVEPSKRKKKKLS